MNIREDVVIDRTELEALLADPPVEDASLGAEALRTLDGRLNHARTALQVELADAESRHAGRVDALDTQRGVVAKCGQVIARLEGSDREDLRTAAVRRRDGAAAQVTTLERDAAAYVLLTAHGPQWLEGLTTRLDALVPLLEGTTAGASAAKDGGGALDSLETELASLEVSQPTEDAASRLAALMAEQGMTTTAAPVSSPTDGESVEDILAGLPELVQVADDDTGEPPAGTDLVAPAEARGGAPWRAIALGVGSLAAAGATLWWLLL
jgi:hypothetical protein